MGCAPPSHRQAIHVLLQQAGFSDPEIDVYLALLSLQTAPVSAIARHSGRGRSNAYMLLRTLEERGLASSIHQGHMLHFVAQPPQRLLQYLHCEEQKLQEMQRRLRETLPYLESLGQISTERPRVTVSQGDDQMRMLTQECNAHDIIGFFSPQGMDRMWGAPSGATPSKGAWPPKGRMLIAAGSGAPLLLGRAPACGEYAERFLPPHIRLRSNLLVWNGTVALLCSDEDHSCIRIDHRHCADALRAIFDMLWPLAAREPPRPPQTSDPKPGNGLPHL